MKTRDIRYPRMMGVKVSPEIAADIKKQARDDDRPVSAYLRRLIAREVKRRNEQQDSGDEK